MNLLRHVPYERMRPCHPSFPRGTEWHCTCYGQRGTSVLRILSLGKRAVSPYCLQHSQGEQTGSHSEGQVNNCLTAQAKIGEITLVGGSTTARTGSHPFSLPLCMLLAASVSPCFLLSCQPSLSRQGNRSTQFPRIETYTSPSAPRLAAAAFGSCYPSRTGKMQWREEAHVPHRFRKELSSSPGEQNASPPISCAHSSSRKKNL